MKSDTKGQILYYSNLLYKISRIVKLKEKESKLEVTRGWVGMERNVCEYSVSLRDD